MGKIDYMDYINDLLERVKELEVKKDKIYVGEVYCTIHYSCQNIIYTPAHLYNTSTFVKFTNEDVSDQINTNIKIFKTWFSKKDVIFYDKIHDINRNNIEKRFIVKKKK